jgi:hypothetical protein
MTVALVQAHPTALAADGPVSAQLRVRRWRLVAEEEGDARL